MELGYNRSVEGRRGMSKRKKKFSHPLYGVNRKLRTATGDDVMKSWAQREDERAILKATTVDNPWF